MHELYAEDRGFQPRTHYNTGFWRHEWRAYRDPDPVPIELALDHRYPGMVALFVELPAGVPAEQLDAFFDAELPGWLGASPVASVSTWSHIPLSDKKPGFIDADPAESPRRPQIPFVEGDPLLSWDHHRDLAGRIDRSGVGRVAFAAPFVATEVGTDRYV